MEKLAAMTPGYVGADINALANEAALVAVMRVARDLQRQQQQQALPSGDAAEPPAEPALAEPELISRALKAQSALRDRQAASVFLRQHERPFTHDELEPYAVSFADFVVALKRCVAEARCGATLTRLRC